jgi:hypothetical protein
VRLQKSVCNKSIYLVAYRFVTGEMNARASACVYLQVWKKGGDNDGDTEWRHCASDGFELCRKHRRRNADTASLSAFHVALTNTVARLFTGQAGSENGGERRKGA